MTDETPMVVMWMGKRVTDLTPEELNAAFSWLMRENTRLRDELTACKVAGVHRMADEARARIDGAATRAHERLEAMADALDPTFSAVAIDRRGVKWWRSSRKSK